MSIEELIKAIKDKKALIETHSALIDEMKRLGSASIACRGSWACVIDYNTAYNIIDKQLESLQEELGRLEEAKHVAQITMQGWLNQSRGG